MAQFSQANPGSEAPGPRGPIGTAAAAFGPWPAAFGSQAAATGETLSEAGQPFRPQPRPGAVLSAHQQQLELPPPEEALPGVLQRMQIPRYYAQEFIGDGTYGSVANAVDLLHPAAREFTAHVVAKRFPLPAPPREARVARKALSEKSGAIKFVVRELSALQEIRRLQEARASAPAGSLQRAALDGVQYVLRLMDVEQRPSGFPTIVTELCETTLLSFMKCFEKNRAPLCCVRTFAAQLAAAVAAMHDSVGMLHRDLKPDNVLLAMVEEELPTARAGESEGRSPVSPAWLHVDPTANGAGDSYSASTPLHRPTSMTHLPSPGEPFTQPRGFSTSDPGTEPRLQPSPNSGNTNATAEGACCPFCGTELSAAAAESLLKGFRGPPPTATRPGSRPRRRQADHEPATVEGSYLATLFEANGVERRAVDTERDADDENVVTPSHFFALAPRRPQRRCRLEVRVCDFGSACFIGPQPEVAAHGLARAAVPPVGLPLCSIPPPTDPSDTSHSMAPAPTAGSNVPVAADADAIDRVEPQQRPYVTHGWTTLQYRAPEDMLSSADQLASSGPQPDDVFRLARPRLGPSVDVWALGAIFAEMLCGQILFYEPSVFNLDPVVDSPWAQLVGILRVVGAPMCRTCRPRGHDDGHAQPCGSGQCWASLAHIATHGRFVRPLAARQQTGMRGPRMVDHTLDMDPRTGALASLPQFRPSLHSFAKGRLAQRCVELDFATEAAAGAAGFDADTAEDAAVVTEIAEGITPEASATFDLLSRMLVLDPTRRIASWEILEHPVFAGVHQRSDATSAPTTTASDSADGAALFKLPLQPAE